ncbi:hypothetical protein Tco_1127604, partial [Tanacetum coccineum]
PKTKVFFETYDWDEEELTSDDEEMVEVKLLSDEEQLTVRKNHAKNGEWVNIILRNINILLAMDEDVD